VRVSADKRSIEWKAQPELAARFVARVPPLTEALLAMAKEMAELDATAHFIGDRCASIVEWAKNRGVTPPLGFMLVKLGRALRVYPEFEERLRRGLMDMDALALASAALTLPGECRDPEKWRSVIETSTRKALKKHVQRHLAERELATTGLVEIDVVVTERVHEDWERCQVLASRKEGKHLDESQTFVRVVDSYLDVNDPQRVKPGTRRMADTRAPEARALEGGTSVSGPPQDSPNAPESSSDGTRPASRTIPAEVERRLRELAEDRCEVPSCTHRVFLQIAHVVRHAQGGSRELDNVWLACTAHHTMFDAGHFRMVGRDEAGRARFLGLDARALGRRAPPGRDGGASAVQDRGLPYAAIRGP
jgi:hypothetical protein